MISFKSYLVSLDEATLSKNSTGTKLMLGGGEAARKFIKATKGLGFNFKSRDIFELTTHSSSAIEVKLGQPKLTYFLKNGKNVFEISGTPSVIDSIFSYPKGRGKGGSKFESEFANDLISYMSAPRGEIPTDLKHPDVMEAYVKLFKRKYKIDLQNYGKDDFKVSVDGGKNQKRSFSFDGNSLNIAKSDGKTLTDVTLVTPDGTFYNSLKMSDSMFIINGSVRNFIEKASMSERGRFYDYFGLDGDKMKVFGEEFYAPTSNSKNEAKKNIENLITQSFGQGYIMVHKFKKGLFVDHMESVEPSIGALEYTYPELVNGKLSKLDATIKFTVTIHGTKFKAAIQFRDGSKAGVAKPTNIRFNFVKI